MEVMARRRTKKDDGDRRKSTPRKVVLFPNTIPSQYNLEYILKNYQSLLGIYLTWSQPFIPLSSMTKEQRQSRFGHTYERPSKQEIVTYPEID